MSTEITLAQQSALAAAQGMLGGLTRLVARAPSGGSEFLKFGKDGIWTFGQQAKQVDPENDFALVNVLSVKEGFVCWTNFDAKLKKKNEKKGEVMVPAGQVINQDNLEDHGWEWKAQQAFDLKFLEGGHVGAQTRYVTSSQGGLEAAGALLDAVIVRVQSGTPFFFPIIALAQDSYIHASWGKTYKPVFEIVGWADTEGNEDPEFVEEAPAVEKKVTKPEPAKAEKPKRVKPVKVEEPDEEPVEEEQEPDAEPEEVEAEETAAPEAATRTRRRR